MGTKLNEIHGLLEELEYPVTGEEAIESIGETTLLLADGEESLGRVISEINDESFGSATELEEEIYANLPTEAVGEPGQSEGDA
ncbi:hypothetical protein EGH25_07290 [Haladaptatus sp. F3-133]|uniref:DUF2795 domain-containing protein n=1 Tax=Halorutilus salinus TaxID=2487751 RepID=A0A9Q4GHU1_9EURY|nr:hypothetical protein [Halorutilus salinus]MCX2819155.1 hypothetical protein [Halorutilus salinus]